MEIYYVTRLFKGCTKTTILRAISKKRQLNKASIFLHTLRLLICLFNNNKKRLTKYIQLIIIKTIQKNVMIDLILVN